MTRKLSDKDRKIFRQPDYAFCNEVVRRSGDNFRRCLQCGCCAAGCPVSHAMKYRPNGIIRLLQLGHKQEALASPDIWLCMSCHTCSFACPMAIDISAMMDAMRKIAIAEGVQISEPGILNFHHEVINSLRRYGRTHKLEIMMRYKLRQRDFFSDMELGLKMLAKRKLDLKPSKVEDPDQIRKIFSELMT